ncbi:MAG: hypothetical protein LBR17_08510 [Bacteroidales bacterium]|jgi:hypothetical protein|nr:hypothetical protein [Bacteroidales bacterium]
MKTQNKILEKRKAICRELQKEIYAYKVDNNTSILEICAKMGFDQPNFHKILRGDSNLRIDTLLLILDFLGKNIKFE